ncbi:AdoMet_MTases domain containing protein [Candidatus Nanopelagicaceae bacterium]
MSNILRAGAVKADFENLKERWSELLQQYFIEPGVLDPRFTIEVACPHCSESDSQGDFNLNGFWHRTCTGCNSLYVSPRLNNKAIEELYSDEYYSEIYGRSMLPLFQKRKDLIGARKFDQAIKHWGKSGSGKVLDIGAGVGEVADVFREHGWTTHVTEMNAVAFDWLRTLGFANVTRGTLEEYNSDEDFDIIMAWGVVEHVLEPDIFLDKVFKLLKPGGIFVSEVPSGESLLVEYSRKTGIDPMRILMGEQHIILYSVEAYRKLHERNGFKNIAIQTNGLDLSTILGNSQIEITDEVLEALQASIDEKMYGDPLRGFWVKE